MRIAIGRLGVDGSYNKKNKNRLLINLGTTVKSVV